MDGEENGGEFESVTLGVDQMEKSQIKKGGSWYTGAYELKAEVKLSSLNIKTYTELLYLTSVIADNINSKFTQDFNIKVLVYSQDELMAVIIKQKGEDAKTSILEQ